MEIDAVLDEDLEAGDDNGDATPTRRTPTPTARDEDETVDGEAGRSHLYVRAIQPILLSCL
jgi:hypothetical protein